MNSRWNICLLLILSAVCSAAQDPTKSEAYGKELPRVKPMTPEESMKAMVLQPGFKVELLAAEPLVHDPVAAEFDERGRLYVVQLPQYNSYVLKDFKKTGSIALLEDEDGDGHYEKSTPFATGLKYPSAIACWDGGVFVGDSPDLLYLKDTDGDGRADLRWVVLTGFGKDKAGESHLNSIRWGLDNRFHIWTSLSGGNVKATADKGGKPVSVKTRCVILDPRAWGKFELSSGGGQHGMSMDDWGRKFTCGNSQPALGIVYDDRYITRNPYLRAPAAAINIAPGGKHTKLYRISPPEPWRVLRTRLRKTGKFRGSDEGGTPFGFFTGATGITIYRGDAWPESHHGNAIVGEVANNLIYRANVTPHGVGVTADRADAGKEFLASRDIWFRPVQFTHAPDGSLVVLDMYRELIEGAAFLPPEFLDHIPADSGNDRGRIYRIAPTKHQTGGKMRLDRMSSAQLVKLLEHPNGWHRDTAARLLYQRQDRSAVSALRALAKGSKSPIGRATAMHSLAALGVLEEALVLNGLDDESADVRVQALRLAERLAGRSGAVRARVPDLAADKELNVRFQAAFTLGAVNTTRAADALALLAVKDGGDSWVRMAVLSSSHDHAVGLFRRLVGDKKFRSTSTGVAFLTTLASQIGAGGKDGDVGTVLTAMLGLESDLRAKLVKALVEKQKGAARDRILAMASGDAMGTVRKIVAESTKKATDQTLRVESRTDAIRSLRLASYEEAGPVLKQLLSPKEAPRIHEAVLQTLVEYSVNGVADLLLEAWPNLGPGVRANAVETLLSRNTWLRRFLAAVKAGRVKSFEVDPARVQLLRRHADPEIARQVSKLFVDRRASRAAVVKQYQPALKLKADTAQGKDVFREHCSACHRLEGVGNEVGAELKGVRQRGMASVLLNILDPNREVKPEYLAYAVITTDGRTLTGMIGAESANNFTVRQIDGTSVTVQRNQIKELRSLGMSFMPEGLEFNIDEQAMADLLGYLDSIN